MSGQRYENGVSDRAYWVEQLLIISEPILKALSQRRLKQSMPVECGGLTYHAETGLASVEQASFAAIERSKYTHLEALGRLLSGIAPWLENTEAGSSEEEKLRSQYSELARDGIAAGTDPASPDYMNFTDGMQPIVDASFLAQALLRAPNELWHKLDQEVKNNVIAALKHTRTRKPVFNNWLLFSATIEAALYMAGENDWDPMRIDFALKQHEQWYLGDGAYGDGKDFHYDYYNGFVIQPMLVDILTVVGDKDDGWRLMRDDVYKRARRYAEVQERFIASDGTYPPIGRSLAYRFGAFQSLAQSSLRDDLPEGVSAGQVRCALTAVIRRTLEMPGNFTTDGGWLTIGFCGHQPSVGESYISTGSLYLCAAIFLPLGLSESHPFWNSLPEEWTARKAWSGLSFGIDTALK